MVSMALLLLVLGIVFVAGKYGMARLGGYRRSGRYRDERLATDLSGESSKDFAVGTSKGVGFNPQHPIPYVLPAEPAVPAWVEGVRRAEGVDGSVGVDWVRQPSPGFADQVVQSLLVRPDGRVELSPPVVFTGELPEIVQAE
ncbi:MAG: hypothetical protein ACRCYQ_16105, partial [Nocardioides sp.]